MLLLSTYPFVEPRHAGQLRLAGFANACLVYGSQNIEAPLKRDILASYGVSDAPAVVAGSVGEHLYRHLAAGRWHSLNLSRLQLLHTLADEDLAAVKTLAHAYLLPIPHGGGSNIKTAEALYSGAYMVGTEAAFRGFEALLDLPDEVTVARSPAEFQSAIRAVLARPPVSPALQQAGRARREALGWQRCLASIPGAVESVLQGERSV